MTSNHWDILFRGIARSVHGPEWRLWKTRILSFIQKCFIRCNPYNPYHFQLLLNTIPSTIFCDYRLFYLFSFQLGQLGVLDGSTDRRMSVPICLLFHNHLHGKIWGLWGCVSRQPIRLNTRPAYKAQGKAAPGSLWFPCKNHLVLPAKNCGERAHLRHRRFFHSARPCGGKAWVWGHRH